MITLDFENGLAFIPVLSIWTLLDVSKDLWAILSDFQTLKFSSCLTSSVERLHLVRDKCELQEMIFDFEFTKIQAIISVDKLKSAGPLKTCRLRECGYEWKTSTQSPRRFLTTLKLGHPWQATFQFLSFKKFYRPSMNGPSSKIRF